MSLLKSEPFAAVESMEELLAIAYRMEQEAIENYTELAERMVGEGRPDMVAVFGQLKSEESGHLDNVVEWSERISGSRPDLANLKWVPAETFDDEGASAVAPELLTAYRAFSMAVRNEERAFLFWTYVAAQTDQERLRQAAEQMAREELGHLTILRRERRRAFHAERKARGDMTPAELPKLELRFSDLLDAAGGQSKGVDDTFRNLMEEARERSFLLGRAPLGISPLLNDGVSEEVAGRLVPLCELLLDCYLDFAERLSSEEDRARAQSYAAQLIHCRSTIRTALE
ncbi:ferritin family protein [Aquibium sp. LZ166]|uniref:Ferritin family protein n=1 Tax=Aquibium pacificus TaxID=3153579 RepID=A0ABV3SIW9_9HYPH